MMDSSQPRVVIVGGGPVGLLLGCSLLRQGVSCQVIERRQAPRKHSRAIGIHPPALELLQRLGLAESFIERGVAVPGGGAFAGARLLGELSFDSCPPPFRFVLSLPQRETERLLERRLLTLGSGAPVIRRGVELTGLRQLPGGVELELAGAQTMCARFVAGCDGKRSLVRKLLGIPFDGASYPDAFIMGDYDDDTRHGSAAAIHLHPRGLVECFPLPGRRRRWVARTDRHLVAPVREDLERIVARRVGHDLSGTACHMLGPFSVQHLLARRFVRGRVALAGDAAHVVSPIGGQGMNLGWFDAWRLSRAFEATLLGSADAGEALGRYERSAVKTARRVRRRGELNMRLGRGGRLSPLRDRVIRALLSSPPAARWMARAFTMRGLEPRAT